jgi:hypothetical protein
MEAGVSVRAAPASAKRRDTRCLPALNRLARRSCSCGPAAVEPRPRRAARVVRRRRLLLEHQESGSRTLGAGADSTATWRAPTKRSGSLIVGSLSKPPVSPHNSRNASPRSSLSEVVRLQAFLRAHDRPIDCLPCRRSRVRIPSAALKKACICRPFLRAQPACASESARTDSGLAAGRPSGVPRKAPVCRSILVRPNRSPSAGLQKVRCSACCGRYPDSCGNGTILRTAPADATTSGRGLLKPCAPNATRSSARVDHRPRWHGDDRIT